MLIDIYALKVMNIISWFIYGFRNDEHFSLFIYEIGFRRATLQFLSKLQCRHGDWGEYIEQWTVWVAKMAAHANSRCSILL